MAEWEGERWDTWMNVVRVRHMDEIDEGQE